MGCLFWLKQEPSFKKGVVPQSILMPFHIDYTVVSILKTVNNSTVMPRERNTASFLYQWNNSDLLSRNRRNGLGVPQGN
ncbi:MAG: hypothetical protein KDC24_07985 [Saprospiraceae bacterium]|nr:hypothetical protein [Saprospiraceae bacterium]